MIRPWSIVPFAFLIVRLVSAAADKGKPIDTQRSSLIVHVGKAGLFSAAAHEHWINAPIASGSVDDNNAAPTVQFKVESGKLTVANDEKLDAASLSEVQSNMQDRVLESSKYPCIVFHSTHVQRKGSTLWNVNGALTLHGVTRPVIVVVSVEEGAYVGTATIKQTEFAIRPIQAGGGAVKVKDELEIRFKIYVRPTR